MLHFSIFPLFPVEPAELELRLHSHLARCAKPTQTHLHTEACRSEKSIGCRFRFKHPLQNVFAFLQIHWDEESGPRTARQSPKSVRQPVALPSIQPLPPDAVIGPRDDHPLPARDTRSIVVETAPQFH